MRWSQILAENPDFCLPHLHSMPPIGGGFPSEYCHAVWYRKTTMVWLPNGEKFLKICLFVLTQTTNVTDTQTDTAWRLRPRLHSITRQQSVIAHMLSSTHSTWNQTQTTKLVNLLLLDPMGSTMMPGLQSYLQPHMILVFDRLTPKVIISRPFSVDHLCQLANKRSK